MNNKFDITCLKLLLINRQSLPRFVPRGRYFAMEAADLLRYIIAAVQANRLSKSGRSDLYFLHSYLVGKLGKQAYTINRSNKPLF